MKMLKYGLNVGMNVLHVPGGLPLDVAVQHQPAQGDLLQLWALVDEEQRTVKAEVYVAVTGEELDPRKGYRPLGTCQLHGGAIVLHALLIQE